MLYRAEAGQYPWRRALYVTVLVFGLTLVAVQWHNSPHAESFVAIRKAFNSLEFAGLTFAVAMLCRHKKVPGALLLRRPCFRAAPGDAHSLWPAAIIFAALYVTFPAIPRTVPLPPRRLRGAIDGVR